jgi:hypothetical protein
VSFLLLNPLGGMQSSQLSTIGIPYCSFSHTEELERTIALLGNWAGFGDPVGRYYRGGLVQGIAFFALITLIIAAAVAVMQWRDPTLTRSHAFGRLLFPGALAAPISLLGQGMVTCSVALLRLRVTTADIFLALVGILLPVGPAIYLSAVTLRAPPVTHAPQAAKARHSKHAVLTHVLRFTVWSEHWVEANPNDCFKKRYLLLLDDMRYAWWVPFEIHVTLIQGAILGVRMNSIPVCLGQQTALLCLAGAMLLITVLLRPCGSVAANLFLIFMKFAGFVIAMFATIHLASHNNGGDGSTTAWALQSSEMATAAAEFVSVLQALVTAVTLLTSNRAAVVRAFRFVFPSLRRLSSSVNYNSASAGPGNGTLLVPVVDQAQPPALLAVAPAAPPAGPGNGILVVPVVAQAQPPALLASSPAAPPADPGNEIQLLLTVPITAQAQSFAAQVANQGDPSLLVACGDDKEMVDLDRECHVEGAEGSSSVPEAPGVHVAEYSCADSDGSSDTSL